MPGKARARRERRRRSAADHALEVWAAWVHDRREYGWPRESSEVRAFWAAQTATVVSGRDNSVRQGVGTPACKESRQRRGGGIPRIDQARLAPHTDRLLRDMDEMGLFKPASVVRVSALFPHLTVPVLAVGLGMTPRHFFRLRRRGISHLEWALSLEPLR